MKKGIERDNLLTTTQVAEMLGVTSITIRRWDDEGRLNSIRFVPNGYRYYKREEIQKLITK